ncbi:MAG: nitrogenase component 1 [Lachnospiraceae bacterium]|nr:nitrogenase component 1 [Lachnospiraceae bacterium]
MSKEVYSITAKELAELGKDNVPEELLSAKHLIYSSPATLAFNSPGAQGFGVKRAGLSVPGSVMLLVAPGCCGRNTQLLNAPGGLGEKFFYLLQDETDIVTGRHLNKVSKAVKEVVDSLEEKPSCVMICITCVDALLGTDMERVCRKATDYAGVPVLPCYMYALTREGRIPPMVAVRKTVYSLLEPLKKNPKTVNLLGEFAPFSDDCEIYPILKSIGITKINELARCRDFEEYKTMAEANFNIILNPESRLAAEDIRKRLNIPSIELSRVYQLDKIHHQYELFANALGVSIDDSPYKAEAEEAVGSFHQKYGSLRFAIGEWNNGDPFEMALALTRYGHQVTEIYGTVSNANFVYIKNLAKLSPDTKIFTNLSPTMLNYDISERTADISIGKDAAFYNAGCPNVPFNEENKPFGYAGVTKLFRALDEAMAKAQAETEVSA